MELYDCKLSDLIAADSSVFCNHDITAPSMMSVDCEKDLLVTTCAICC